MENSTALAAGCTVVIHPSSTTSLSLLSLAQKINHLLPKGVFNVITGKGSKSGEYMLHHTGFNKLAFTVPPKSVEKLVWLLLKC